MSDSEKPALDTITTKYDWNKYLMTYFIALAIIIAFVFFILYLVNSVGEEDKQWERLMLIFASVEAIVFAAVGFIFGREVNKKVAKKAEANEEAAKKEAKEAQAEKQEEREKGVQLATMIIHGGSGSSGGISVQGVKGGPTPTSPIVAKAKELYPEI